MLNDLENNIASIYVNHIHNHLERVANEKERYIRYSSVTDKDKRRTIAESIACGDFEFQFNNDYTDDEIALFKANMIFWLLDMNDMADKMAAVNIKMILMRTNLKSYIINANGMSRKFNLKNIASKPRNKHHDEAVKIMRETWAIYPHVSANKMKFAIILHFNNEVGNDAISGWIKKYNLKPDVKPQNKPFCLVL